VTTAVQQSHRDSAERRPWSVFMGLSFFAMVSDAAAVVQARPPVRSLLDESALRTMASVGVHSDANGALPAS
jgi:hypothetical protein